MDFPEGGNQKMQKILIFAGIGFLFLLFIIFAIVSQLSRGNQEATSATPSPGANQGTSAGINPDSSATTEKDTSLFREPTAARKKAQSPAAGAAAKVGEEIIYSVDVTREVSALPNPEDPSVIESSFEKIINDSVTLQGAAKAGHIKLDSSVYNSANKDYAKRIALVDEAKRAIAANGDGYEGSFVSIWFHNQRPGRVGYAQGKQIAYNKIKPLYDEVKAGRMTMLEASDAIIADDRLFDVDEAYQVNSYGEFTGSPSTPPTFDEGFNAQLAKLKPGQVTQLTTVKDENEQGNMVDALYIFGKIDKINSNKGYTTYEEWLKINKPKYEVIEY